MHNKQSLFDSLIIICFTGWHSAVISQYDDLYMFGWNESGQLAMPTNLVNYFHSTLFDDLSTNKC